MRVMSVDEKGVEVLELGYKSVLVTAEPGYTVKAEHAVEAICILL